MFHVFRTVTFIQGDHRHTHTCIYIYRTIRTYKLHESYMFHVFRTVAFIQRDHSIKVLASTPFNDLVDSGLVVGLGLPYQEGVRAEKNPCFKRWYAAEDLGYWVRLCGCVCSYVCVYVSVCMN